MAQTIIGPRLQETIRIHKRILENLNASKARNDKLLDNYKRMLESEMHRPANRFMEWTRIMYPLLESMISAKATDHQVIGAYKDFLKEVLEYESARVVNDSQADVLSENVEYSIAAMLRLEQELNKQTTDIEETLIYLRARTIETYLSTPKKFRQDADGYCVYCGALLDKRYGTSEVECMDCSQVPFELKEELVEKFENDDEEDEEKIERKIDEVEVRAQPKQKSDGKSVDLGGKNTTKTSRAKSKGSKKESRKEQDDEDDNEEMNGTDQKLGELTRILKSINAGYQKSEKLNWVKKSGKLRGESSNSAPSQPKEPKS